MAKFEGTSAVVTGASSGIGRAVAIALAEAGAAKILVHYRKNQAGAEETAEAIKQFGTDPILCSADIACGEARQQLVATAFEQLGTVETWVNNAGADVLTGEAASLDFQSKLEHLLSVDVVGTIDLSRLVAKRMLAIQQEEIPSFTFVGWDQAPLGMEGDAGQMFGPVKAAVMAFANSFAQSLAPQIRVNTIAPGWIQTAWGDTTSEYWNGRARGQSLMNRWGKPEDIANAVVFAADPVNSFLTGQTITLNGGWNRHYVDASQD
ncbi:MAG: SDR family NAD(P)-dependent oxidoreductase [Rubripirellula sp.]